MIKKLYLLIAIGLLGIGVATAQQDEQFTQFMYNKTFYNPGHAGSNEAPCFTLISRNQWLGIEGAPKTQMLSFNMPLFNQRVGAGANIVRQTIGITETLFAEAVYSYRIRIGRGHLGMGLMGGVRFFKVNYSEAEAIQPTSIDNAIPADLQSKYLPNFGAGLYYSSQKFFIGASVPHILQNSIDFSDIDQNVSREVRHFYIMGGFLLDLGDKVQIQPQTLLKYVKGAPFDADVNLNLIFSDRVTTGISYRLGGSKRTGIGESLSLVMGIQVSDPVLFGISYDYTLSELNKFNNGTIEGVFRYCIGGRSEGNEFISPRFF